MLRKGATILTVWSAINFALAALILTTLVVFDADSPLLVMVFERPEIAQFDPRVIAALNCLTILYNSCSVALSVLVLYIIRSGLVHGERRAFWALLVTIGFVEVMANLASAQVGHARWQVNVLLSVLYVVGMGLAGAGIFRSPAPDLQPRNLRLPLG